MNHENKNPNQKKSFPGILIFFIIGAFALMMMRNTAVSERANVSFSHQIEHLVNLNLHIKALFDSIIGNQSFVMKIIPIIKANINNSKYVVFENVIQRLIKLHNLLGHDFFTIYNIKTITVDDFYNLNDDEKIMYISSIQTETLIILEHTIENYEKFNMVNLKIDNLLNPFSIHIENDTCTDYDVEDIKDFL